MTKKENVKKCDRTVSFESLGFERFAPCSYPAKYVITYNGIRGGTEKENVCGVHLRAIKMTHERLIKMDIYSGLTIKNIAL